MRGLLMILCMVWPCQSLPVEVFTTRRRKSMTMLREDSPSSSRRTTSRRITASDSRMVMPSGS
jgi:hypothetical protein